MRTTFPGPAPAASSVLALAAAVFIVHSTAGATPRQWFRGSSHAPTNLQFAGQSSRGSCQFYVKYAQSGGLHSWMWSQVSTTANTADGVLEALHTVSTVRTIQELYSIHNPNHDYNLLLNKYLGEEDALLAAIVDKYLYEPARARRPYIANERAFDLADNNTIRCGGSFAHAGSCYAASAWLVGLTAIAWELLGSGCMRIRKRRNLRRGARRKALLCPISLELMTDPVVVVESGQCYERVAIEEWFRTHDTDPVSNTRLASKKIISNHALRHAIETMPMLHREEEHAPLSKRMTAYALLRWIRQLW